MNVLIIGSGAREHAIAVALKRSTHNPQLFCCSSSMNPGISPLTNDYWLGSVTDVSGITHVATKWKIDLAIIGPEAPLEVGLADALWQNCIPTVGPKKNLAQIETNKSFARNLMKKYSLPGLPRYKSFADLNGVNTFLQELGEGNYVIKANGLMAGKGVKVAGEHLHSFADAIAFCKEIFALGQTLLIEEKLIGQEFSLMCFCDGKNSVSMPLVQDHKRAFVGDRGPNTGGMGSYSDVHHRLPFLTDDDFQQALKINENVLQALSVEMNDQYFGIFYGSFIATRLGVYVIEFNARFGDPEALNVLSILKSDFLTICLEMVTGNLSPDHVEFAHLATVCKYVVPQGYPENPVKNKVIDISAVNDKSQLYLCAVHAADGKIFATGSRTAAYVGIADSIAAAEAIAEKEIIGILGPLFHREDIGTEKLITKRVDEMRRLRSSR